MTAARSAPTARRPSRRRAPADLPFLNRELSWLDFNERVLHEARDVRTLHMVVRAMTRRLRGSG